MHFFEPNRTQFDLNFSLFGIHVRVHPMFWIVSAVLGWNDKDLKWVLLWIGVVFVSILIHELGHVLMGRVFGTFGHIVLYSFGGLAIGSSDLRRRWQRNLVYIAGPLAQFLLLGLVYLMDFVIKANQMQASKLMEFLFIQLVWVNLAWPILNLFPIWPLDGGKISRETFEWLMPETGKGISLIVSAVVSGILAVNSFAAYHERPLIPFLPGGLYLALFFALFAVTSIQEWQIIRHRSRHPWEQDEDSW